MGDRTGIAWARHTFNPWIGCTEVSPGCDACYARELDKRHRYGGATHWGAGVERYVTSLDNWLKPERWSAIVERERASGRIEDSSDWHAPGFAPVFPSMCDPFDKEIDAALRFTFWQLIEDNPLLTFLLLSKRIGNAVSMLPPEWLKNPPAHVWLGASVVNQQEADRDLPKLLATPAAKRFVSYEPAIGPIDFAPWIEYSHLGQVDWIIVGGESHQGKHRARPFELGWARDTVRQCKEAGVACLVKQLGSNPAGAWEPRGCPFPKPMKDRAGADPAEWPEELRVQQFPTLGEQCKKPS